MTTKKKASTKSTRTTGGKAAKKTVKKAGRKAAVKRTTTGKARKKTAPEAKSSVRSGLLNIDYSLCRGCGGCAEALPELFEMRDERAWVVFTGLIGGNLAERAVRTCPYYAIKVE